MSCTASALRPGGKWYRAIVATSRATVIEERHKEEAEKRWLGYAADGITIGVTRAGTLQQSIVTDPGWGNTEVTAHTKRRHTSNSHQSLPT